MSNSSNDLTAKIRIDGDAKGAQQAIDATDKGLQHLSESERKAAAGADAISAAFRTLGVRPMQEIVAETQKLQAALATVRNSGVIGADQERAIAAFNAQLAALRAEASKVSSATADARAGVSSLASEARNAESALGGIGRGALQAVAALAGLHTVGEIASDIVKTGAAFETLEARLSSLLGSSEAAKDAMADIKQLAITTPFEVSALADSFVKLTAFGMQPTMEQMRALSDTAATLGGGTEALAGVTVALGQAWAKGKLQGEEILQLAERGVPVWDVLAQATGKNAGELQKMAEAGELGRSTILKLIAALGEMNAGASEKLMATFSGAVSNAKDALAEFYDMVAKAGVLEYLTGQLQDLLAEFERMKQSGELQEQARQLASDFISFAEGVKSALEAVKALSGIIELSVEVWIAWRVAGMSLIPVLSGVGREAGGAAAQASALGRASETAAVGMGRVAAAARLLKGLTLVGLVEGAIQLAAEFFRAKKEAEDLERKVNKTLAKPPENNAAKEIKLVATEAEAARFQLTEFQAGLIEAQKQGKATGEALADMVKKADISTVKGVSDLLNGLESVRKGAMATGDQIQQSIQDRLNKMTASELRDFGIMVESAFNRGEISAEQLAATLNGQVDAALKKLGSSLEVSAGGMTAKFMEVAQQIGIVERSFDRLKESGQNAGAVLKSAFEAGLNAAKSVQDLEGLAVAIRQAGEAGRLSQKEVGEFLDSIKAKVDAATDGVNSLAEAFKTLGMKTPEELKKSAKAAEEAFLIIKQQSGFTRAELENVSNAFKRYAEASIAANGGVASDTLRVQASFYGLTIETDKAGKSLVKAAESANEASAGFTTLADETAASADAAGGAADEYDRLADSISGARNASTRPGASGSLPGGTATSNGSSGLPEYWTSPDGRNIVTYDPRREALKAGATTDNIDEIVRLATFEIERIRANNNGNMPTVSQFQGIIPAIMREMAAGSMSATAQRSGSSSLSASSSHTVTINLGSQSKTLNLASSADASQLVSILQQLETDSARAY